jgi:hypothetical protein
MKFYNYLLTGFYFILCTNATCNHVVGTSGTICKGNNCLSIKTLADSLKKELEGQVVKYAFVIRYQLSQESRQGGLQRFLSIFYICPQQPHLLTI